MVDMNYSPSISQVETVLKYIKEQLYTGQLQPGERLPAERRLAERLGVGRAHVRAALQKLEFRRAERWSPRRRCRSSNA